MTVILELKPEVEARLQAQADAKGMSVEDFLQTLVERVLSPIPVEEAIALYTARSVTQGQAAALAGLSRAEFIEALGKAGVSVFQYDSVEELLKEAAP
ncbi:MAG TPA: UPF0175 family protein [Chthonomonadaceae bacterium]|jgi:predicted DNA-binding protein (UPF0251 family)|nr:UPF0175 family protein [Chthonomonadaceae bacterium]